MDQNLKKLLKEIDSAFESKAVDRTILLAYANGDAWSIENIQETLGHRPWKEVTRDDLYQCGYSEIASYLTIRGLVHYLPALMSRSLEEPEPAKSRLSEVTRLIVVPADIEFQDVWECFGDGQFESPLSPSAQTWLARSGRLRSSLTKQQRSCVGKFIEVVENPNGSIQDENFLNLLSRFSQYWTTY